MIKLQWVDRDFFETADEYWDCAIPDDELDQVVRYIINLHEDEIEDEIKVKNQRINQNIVSNDKDIIFFFNNRLVLFGFRYYISLKRINSNDVEVIIDNQTYHIAYNGRMKFKGEEDYYEYNRKYDDLDLYDKYLSELAFHVESNPLKEELKNEN